MRTRTPGAVKYPKVYQNFKTADEIGEVINRSRSYVNKALREGFTKREMSLLNNYKGIDLFKEAST